MYTVMQTSVKISRSESHKLKSKLVQAQVMTKVVLQARLIALARESGTFPH